MGIGEGGPLMGALVESNRLVSKCGEQRSALTLTHLCGAPHPALPLAHELRDLGPTRQPVRDGAFYKCR